MCAQVHTQPNACGGAWNVDTSLYDLSIHSSTTRVLSISMRSSRPPSDEAKILSRGGLISE